MYKRRAGEKSFALTLARGQSKKVESAYTHTSEAFSKEPSRELAQGSRGLFIVFAFRKMSLEVIFFIKQQLGRVLWSGQYIFHARGRLLTQV